MEFTSLFQLNFITHMCLPQNHNGIYPYFNKMGYKIRAIESTIPLEDTSIEFLKTLNIQKKNVTPEMILSNTKNLLLLECKIGDFQKNYSLHASKQAAGYLSLEKKYMSEFLGYSSNSNIDSSVVYMISNGDTSIVADTLNSIKTDLPHTNENLDFEIFEIALFDDGIYIIEKDTDKKFKILDNGVSNNPIIFYLFPFEPSGKIDSHGENVIKLQVKNKLRSLIGRQLYNDSITVHVKEISENINQLGNLLNSQFRRKINWWISKNIINHLEDLKKICSRVSFTSNTLSIPNITDTERKKLESYLVSSQFLTHNFEEINSIQLSLNLPHTSN